MSRFNTQGVGTFTPSSRSVLQAPRLLSTSRIVPTVDPTGAGTIAPAVRPNIPVGRFPGENAFQKAAALLSGVAGLTTSIDQAIQSRSRQEKEEREQFYAADVSHQVIEAEGEFQKTGDPAALMALRDTVLSSNVLPEGHPLRIRLDEKATRAEGDYFLEHRSELRLGVRAEIERSLALQQAAMSDPEHEGWQQIRSQETEEDALLAAEELISSQIQADVGDDSLGLLEAGELRGIVFQAGMTLFDTLVREREKGYKTGNKQRQREAQLEASSIVGNTTFAPRTVSNENRQTAYDQFASVHGGVGSETADTEYKKAVLESYKAEETLNPSLNEAEANQRLQQVLASASVMSDTTLKNDTIADLGVQFRGVIRRLNAPDASKKGRGNTTDAKLVLDDVIGGLRSSATDKQRKLSLTIINDHYQESLARGGERSEDLEVILDTVQSLDGSAPPDPEVSTALITAATAYMTNQSAQTNPDITETSYKTTLSTALDILNSGIATEEAQRTSAATIQGIMLGFHGTSFAQTGLSPRDQYILHGISTALLGVNQRLGETEGMSTLAGTLQLGEVQEIRRQRQDEYARAETATKFVFDDVETVTTEQATHLRSNWSSLAKAIGASTNRNIFFPGTTAQELFMSKEDQDLIGIYAGRFTLARDEGDREKALNTEDYTRIVSQMSSEGLIVKHMSSGDVFVVRDSQGHSNFGSDEGRELATLGTRSEVDSKVSAGVATIFNNNEAPLGYTLWDAVRDSLQEDGLLLDVSAIGGPTDRPSETEVQKLTQSEFDRLRNDGSLVFAIDWDSGTYLDDEYKEPGKSGFQIRYTFTHVDAVTGLTQKTPGIISQLGSSKPVLVSGGLMWAGQTAVHTKTQQRQLLIEEPAEEQPAVSAPVPGLITSFLTRIAE